MIKVALFYKVSMYDSDWMMTEAEYDEFRKEANNLPVFFTGPQIKKEEYEKEITKLWNKIDEKDETIEILTKKPEGQEEEPVVSKSMGAGLIEKEHEGGNKTGFYEIVGIEEEPKVEEPKKHNQSGNYTMVLAKKPGRKTNRDYTKYIEMFVVGYTKNQIIQDMVADWGITESSGNSYYFSKVKPEGELKQAEAKDRANEKEKKRLAEHLEKKIQVIPPTVYNKPDNGKCFSDEDREKLQKKLGLK